ncbi:MULTISPECIES: hypothetical protein [Clostridium]|jgi:hypothetical protein|uniref:hypothetical protein n=1 Tax=Clostridium TaxID=1485 RepID=UPI000E81FB28|nr:hypothetical protein [Clostridium tyrobutyricum]HBF77165.1 hypothetical protein [Clostridiaceae bacterium]
MAKDNKTIETEKTSIFYIILVKRDGVKKFISKDYLSCFPCTVLLNKAKRFYTEQKAQNFIDNKLTSCNDIEVIKPIKVESTLKLC